MSPAGSDLPNAVVEVLDLWGLAPAGPATCGRASVVVPVDGAGEPAVLKVNSPAAPLATEHLALRRWDGRGAVRLLRAAPARGALLLEQLTTTDLADLWDEEACGIAADLLRRLHGPPLPAAPPLSSWARDVVADLPDAALPRRTVDRVRRLVAALTSDEACNSTLLHGDLHYGHVLADRDGSWRAIAPHPLNGDPAFEFAPMLWHRTAELGTGATLRYLTRRRLEVLCERTGVDWDRARDWSLVRLTARAAEAARAGERRQVGLLLALLKAVDD